MLADVTITIPTSVIHATAWFTIGAATAILALAIAELRGRGEN